MHVKFEFAWSFLHFYHAKKIEVFFVIKVVISGNKMGKVSKNYSKHEIDITLF